MQSSFMVSIIIPVYNAEKYILECLDSLLNQTYPYFEIICVDDGSTDSSYKLLQEYENKDSRITILRQENQYAGAARNNGLKIAKGKYVMFLDADDFFRQDMLEQIVERAETDRTEILIFDVFQFDNVTQKVIQTTWKPLKKEMFGEGIKSAVDVADVIFDFASSAPWNKLFLREFILKYKLWFQHIQRTNDLFFVYAALSCAEKIGILDKKLLYYRDNNAQSLQGSGSCTPTIFAQALFALQEYLKEKKTFELYQKSFNHMALSVSIYNLNNMRNREVYFQVYDSLQKEIFPKLHLGCKTLESLLVQTIRSRERLIIYGAGTIAVAVLRFLLYRCGYKKESIIIAVSDMRNNLQEIDGIEIREFKMIPNENRDDLVIIAMSDEKIQNEIESGISHNGFQRSVKIGFYEMADLIRNYTD